MASFSSPNGEDQCGSADPANRGTMKILQEASKKAARWKARGSLAGVTSEPVIRAGHKGPAKLCGYSEEELVQVRV